MKNGGMKTPNVKKISAADIVQALLISEKPSVVIAPPFSRLRIWQFAAVVRRPCEIRPLQTLEPPCETDSITASTHTSPSAEADFHCLKLYSEFVVAGLSLTRPVSLPYLIRGLYQNLLHPTQVRRWRWLPGQQLSCTYRPESLRLLSQGHHGCTCTVQILDM
jgi:hypothetical protein